MIYQLCHFCGAHLDPGEHCECEDENVKKQMRIEKYIDKNVELSKSGQYKMKGIENYG